MIKVCDAIMGSGKSSAAITYMNEHSDQKFIYITPYLDEATRIRKGCPALRFAEPSDKIPSCGFTKTGHTIQLLREGRNVTTTHQAFKFYTKEISDLVKEKGYTLIIDEDVEVLEQVKCHPADLDLLVRAGYLSYDDGGYTVINESYDGVALSDIFRILQSRKLITAPYVQNGDDGDSHSTDDECSVEIDGAKRLVYWILPPDLITSFRDVFILTYLFDAQDIHHLLEMHHLEYQRIGITKDANGTFRFSDSAGYLPDIAMNLAQYIHILDHKKLNSIGDDRYALSSSWYKRSVKNVEQLRKHITNYFLHLHGGSNGRQRMWGTYKDAQAKLAGKGYTKQYVVFNKKASNEYRERCWLAYPVNLFMNVGIRLFYKQYGIDVSDDTYALSTMIQWIWRSAIRDGKEIYLYLPSSRMRKLLEDWMEDVRQQYIAWENTQEAGGCDHE